jgi:hypothetical protein
MPPRIVIPGVVAHETAFLRKDKRMRKMSEDRKDILLKAAFDLLKRQNECGIVLNLLEQTVFYDEADCDGYCLMQDIAIELDIEDLLGL